MTSTQLSTFVSDGLERLLANYYLLKFFNLLILQIIFQEPMLQISDEVKDKLHEIIINQID